LGDRKDFLVGGRRLRRGSFTFTGRIYRKKFFPLHPDLREIELGDQFVEFGLSLLDVKLPPHGQVPANSEVPSVRVNLDVADLPPLRHIAVHDDVDAGSGNAPLGVTP
jgi:hypothetical protein